MERRHVPVPPVGGGHELSTPGTVLVAHPSPDLYGADLQLVQTARGLVEHGWRVVVVIPEKGPLVSRLEEAGAEVLFLRFPVLRKASLRPRAAAKLLLEASTAVPRSIRLLRRTDASVLLVNTVTLPWWVVAGRLARVAVVVHLHEAETGGSRWVQRALVAPLRLASVVVVISQAALGAMVGAAPALSSRARLIYNGVAGPEAALSEPERGRRPRLLVVGRLSPRKAPHVALEALALLRASGRDVELELAGTPFAGYEWYEDSLRARAAEPDLSGLVHFSGYCSPVWPALERATVVLAPSLHEPFGNVVVEAQLARRPVVAAAALGHLETVEDKVSGLLVTPDDPIAMAEAVEALLDDPAGAAAMVEHAHEQAAGRFSTRRYGDELHEVVLAAQTSTVHARR